MNYEVSFVFQHVSDNTWRLEWRYSYNWFNIIIYICSLYTYRLVLVKWVLDWTEENPIHMEIKRWDNLEYPSSECWDRAHVAVRLDLIDWAGAFFSACGAGAWLFRTDLVLVLGTPWLACGSFIQAYSRFGNSPLLRFSTSSWSIDNIRWSNFSYSFSGEAVANKQLGIELQWKKCII